MQDIASQVAQLENRINALQSSQQTLTTLFIIALIVIAVLIGMLIATRSRRPLARPAQMPRPEPRMPQAPAAAEKPKPAPAPVPAAAQAAPETPGAIKPEIAAVITAAVTTFLAGRPFVIRGVHLQTDPSHMWGKVGRQLIQMSHVISRTRQ